MIPPFPAKEGGSGATNSQPSPSPPQEEGQEKNFSDVRLFPVQPDPAEPGTDKAHEHGGNDKGRQKKRAVVNGRVDPHVRSLGREAGEEDDPREDVADEPHRSAKCHSEP